MKEFESPYITKTHTNWFGKIHRVSPFTCLVTSFCHSCSLCCCWLYHSSERSLGFAFSGFQVNAVVKTKWIVAAQWESWIPGKSARICGGHFVSAQSFFFFFFFFFKKDILKHQNKNLNTIIQRRGKGWRQSSQNRCSIPSLNGH